MSDIMDRLDKLESRIILLERERGALIDGLRQIVRRLESQTKPTDDNTADWATRDDACRVPEREETITVGEHAKPLMASHHARKRPQDPDYFGSTDHLTDQMDALHKEG